MENKFVLNLDLGKDKINKNIYGHFAEHLGRCVYEGLWVGLDSEIPNTHGIRNDVLEALKELSIPVLRWPGGCFAEEYHWKDGVGPYEKRKRMVNANWGKVVENNHFGTHEFLTLCELLGCEPYININLGGGTVQEMQEWIEYITFDGESPMANWRKENGREKPWKLKYIGLGNENWGCGGNMRPEYYADEYRRYQTFVRNYQSTPIYKIACGASDYNTYWTEVLMREAGRFMDGLSLHYYTVPHTWEDKGSATDFNEDEWYLTLKKALAMDEIIQKHATIMDKYDPQKRVGLIVDEWGAWYNVEPGTNPGFLYQQNALRDALVAGITLNILNSHCDRVHMANIAQLVNVLQSVILTDKEKMVKTPTYYVFKMYKAHMDATYIPAEVISVNKIDNIPQIHISASKNGAGDVNITICNLSADSEGQVHIDLRGEEKSKVTGEILTAQHINSRNTFENPREVETKEFNEAYIENGILKVALPAKSVARLTLG